LAHAEIHRGADQPDIILCVASTGQPPIYAWRIRMLHKCIGEPLKMEMDTSHRASTALALKQLLDKLFGKIERTVGPSRSILRAA
jgi:hypothetical protein